MGRGFARRKGAWKTAGDRSPKSEVRSQRSGGNRGQRTVEAGKQETQENRKGMIAIFLSREGMKPPAADREGRDATETFSR